MFAFTIYTGRGFFVAVLNSLQGLGLGVAGSVHLEFVWDFIIETGEGHSFQYSCSLCKVINWRLGYESHS